MEEISHIWNSLPALCRLCCFMQKLTCADICWWLETEVLDSFVKRLQGKIVKPMLQHTVEHQRILYLVILLDANASCWEGRCVVTVGCTVCHNTLWKCSLNVGRSCCSYTSILDSPNLSKHVFCSLERTWGNPSSRIDQSQDRDKGNQTGKPSVFHHSRDFHSLVLFCFLR